MTAPPISPPRLAVRLLERLLPAELREGYLGDLEESFRCDVVPARGLRAARRWFWRETLRAPLSLRPHRAPVPARPHRGDGAMPTLLADLRFALRTLLRRPGFTALVVATTALGIGATTAIFSVVSPILFEPIPYPRSDRVMTVWQTSADGERGNLGFATAVDVAQRVPSLGLTAAWGDGTATLTGGTTPELLSGQRVSAAYFRVLGVHPAIGRDFTAAEDVPEAARVTILSDALWKRRFSGDPAIVGRAITLDGNPVTVIGVMPAGFVNVAHPAAQYWTALRYEASLPWACRSCRHLHLVGRLRDGATEAQAARELHRLFAELRREYPDKYGNGDLAVVSLRDQATGGARRVLLVVLGGVAFVLLIAIVNVMNLLLAQGVRRRGELAVRVALGASRRRIVAQLLTESLVLAGAGGALGVAVAQLGVKGLIALGPPGLPLLDAIDVDARVLLFATAVTVAAGVAFGLLPALQATRAGSRDIQLAARRTVGSARATRTTLVAAEVALAFMLLVGAGLLFRSVGRLLRVDSGFDARQVLTMQVRTSGTRMRTNDAVWRYFDRVLAAVRAVPGVESADLTSQLPLSGDYDGYGVHPEHDGNPNPELDHSAFRYAVSDGYLQTMRVPIRRGRAFTPADRQGSGPVAIVDETLARKYWPRGGVVGQRVRIGPADEGAWYTIVGVAGSVHQQSLVADAANAIYVPSTQWRFADDAMSLVVRTRTDPAALAVALRKTIWSVDPDQPITRVATMEALVAATAGERRFALLLFGIFAGVAVVLAAAGIYGVLAGMVNERVREIGVRAALGATAADIVGLVVRQGLAMTAVGIVAGMGGAVALSRAIASLLFATSPLDTATYLGMVLLLAGVGLVACWLPARRAAAVDPAETLRAD